MVFRSKDVLYYTVLLPPILVKKMFLFFIYIYILYGTTTQVQIFKEFPILLGIKPRIVKSHTFA